MEATVVPEPAPVLVSLHDWATALRRTGKRDLQLPRPDYLALADAFSEQAAPLRLTMPAAEPR